MTGWSKPVLLQSDKSQKIEEYPVIEKRVLPLLDICFVHKNPVYWHLNVLAVGSPKHDTNLDIISFCLQIYTLDQQESIYCNLSLQLAEHNESNFLRSEICHRKTEGTRGLDCKIKRSHFTLYKL